MSRRGFTVIELLTTMVIVSILASITYPLYHDAKKNAEATKIISDIRVIQQAALEYFADNGTYPRNRGWRRVPPELVSHLRDGFTFQYGGTDYRWRRWSTATGIPRRNSRALIGVTVRTSDRELLQKIRDLWNGDVWGNNRRINLALE